jgi:BirA family biotin operon repressor/biotin-[acetyl-CoA-carboxylase] ligase
MADIQTNGRGQRNKTWQSDAYENLTFSLSADINLWKINSLIDLNRLIALSLQNFFTEIGLPAKVKWPNDIMVNDKKVCGVLIENFFQSGKPKSVIGIGINVNQKTFEAPRSTSIFNEKNQHFIPRELLEILLHSLNKSFNNLPIQDSSKIKEEYDNRLWKRKKNTFFELESENAIRGKIIGTTDDGNLQIECGDKIRIFRNGMIKY